MSLRSKMVRVLFTTVFIAILSAILFSGLDTPNQVTLGYCILVFLVVFNFIVMAVSGIVYLFTYA